MIHTRYKLIRNWHQNQQIINRSKIIIDRYTQENIKKYILFIIQYIYNMLVTYNTCVNKYVLLTIYNLICCEFGR